MNSINNRSLLSILPFILFIIFSCRNNGITDSIPIEPTAPIRAPFNLVFTYTGGVDFVSHNMHIGFEYQLLNDTLKYYTLSMILCKRLI